MNLTAVFEQVEGGYVAWIEEMEGVATQGATIVANLPPQAGGTYVANLPPQAGGTYVANLPPQAGGTYVANLPPQAGGLRGVIGGSLSARIVTTVVIADNR
jgi:hypothetical protein